MHNVTATRVIAVVNQKGGVGKTTTALNLAAGLARSRKKTLLIDADSQANATAVLAGLEVATGPRLENVATLYEVMMRQADAGDAIVEVSLDENGKVPSATMHLLPSHLILTRIDSDLTNVIQRESRLALAMRPVLSNYDFVIVDCPPSLGVMTVNALAFASEILVPVDPGLFPMVGLGMLLETIEQIKEINPQLRIMGILPSMFDSTNLATGTLEQLVDNFGELVLKTPIPRRVVMGESHTYGLDIFAMPRTKPAIAASKAYGALIREVLNRG